MTIENLSFAPDQIIHNEYKIKKNMKNKINIDVETVRLIYTKYRKHITYGGIIAVSLIVFCFFVLPKILSLSSIS